MTQIDGFELRWRWVKKGDYVFSEHFQQRKIGKTFGSVRSLIPLRTASGAQWAESELEAKAIEQFAFLPGIYDIYTQPVVKMDGGINERTYTPDILIQMSCMGAPPTQRFVIEVKRSSALASLDLGARERIGIGRRFAKAIAAEFRILTEAELETPYLHNTRMLAAHTDENPGPGWRELLAMVDQAPITWGEAEQNLIDLGISRPDARTAIEFAIAGRDVSTDLSTHISEHSLLAPRVNVPYRLRWQQDPFLMIVHRANNGADLAA